MMTYLPNLVHENRFPFTPFPDGLYAVAFSKELKPGQVHSITFMGEKVVLFRGASGEVGAIASYCPHLGADLAYGLVKKDALQCPFHGLRFNKNGQCLIRDHHPDRYAVRSWQAYEKYGLIFLTHDPLQQGLTIKLPEWDLSAWGKIYPQCFKIKSHPQEILENSVDRLHFYKVHHYQNVQVARPFETQGAEFTVSYDIERTQGLLPYFGSKKIKFHLYIHAYGLGFSQAEISIPQYGLEIKQIVMPTPLDGEFIFIRTLTSAKVPERILALPSRYLPKFMTKNVSHFLSYISAQAFLKDFLPDITIWENKKYIQDPKNLVADGEFMQYRQWASQFYRLKNYSIIANLSKIANQ